MQLNDERNKERFGARVSYGDVIQLMHVKSGKFLTVLPKVLAELDKEASRLSLEDGGSTNAWLKIMPRFKLRSEGDNVYLGDLVTLYSLKTSGAIFASTSPYPNEVRKYEASCSPVKLTSWKLQLYAPSSSTLAEGVKFSRMIRLFHPEASGFLAAPTNPPVPGVEPKKKDAYLFRPQGVDEFDEVLHSKAVWLIEDVNVTQGGQVTWRHVFRLRAVNSGLYLCIEGATGLSKTDRTARLVLTENRENENTHFSFLCTTSIDQSQPLEFRTTAKLISVKTGLQVHSTGQLVSTRENAGKLKFNFRLEGSSQKLDADAFVILDIPETYARDINESLSRVAKLHKFIGLNRDKANITKENALSYKTCLERSVFFLTKTADTDPLHCQGIPIVPRQNLVREQKYMDLVVAALLSPYTLGRFRLETVKKENSHVHTLTRLAWKVLRHCFEDHRRNELYVGKCGWIPNIIDHLGFSIGAEDVLSTLLDNNKQLLDEYVNEDLIRYFIKFIREKGQNGSYVSFLKNLCVCLDQAIGETQEMILESFVNDPENSRFLITLRHDTKSPPVAKWETQEELRNGTVGQSQEKFMAREIYDEGFHQVYLRWESNVKDLTPQALYGKDEVPIEEFCAAYTATKKARRADPALARRHQLAEYFLEQLLLFAEMSFDRSYNCIEKISQLMSYSLVLTCMANKKIPHFIRAAFADIMTTVHVDRSPQQTISAPQLTREYSDKEVGLPACEDPTKFWLLENYIADHFELLHGIQVAEERGENTYTLSLLRLLRVLVMSGNYASLDEIRELVDPLIETLDGRSDLAVRPKSAEEQARLDRIRAENRQTIGTVRMSNETAAGVAGGDIEMATLSPVTEVKKKSDEDEEDEDEDKDELETPARWIEDENTTLIMEAKTKMCDVLLKISDLRLDFRLGKLLQVYHKAQAHNPPRELTAADFAHLVESHEAKQLDLDEISETPLVTVLLDLIMYQNKHLVDASLSLLVNHFSQRKALLDAASRVNLLTDEASIAVKEKMHRSIYTLNNHFEYHEVWGCPNETRQFNHTIFLEVCDTLDKMTDACKKRVEGSTKRAPDHVVQTMLRDAGLVECMLRGLGIDFEDKEDQKHLVEIFKKIYKLLKAFVTRNPANQRILVKHIERFMEHMNYRMGAADLITAIYADNLKLCNNVPAELVSHFIDCNERFGPASRYLDFLRTIVVCREVAVRRNQDLVLKLLTEPGLKNTMMLCNVPGSPEYKERMQWVKRGDDKDPESKLSYHISLLLLFSRCTAGKNRYAEAKCQNVYPAKDVLHVLLDEEVTVSFFAAMTRFFYDGFLESEITIVGLQMDPMLWKLFTKYLGYINSIDWAGSVDLSNEIVLMVLEDIMPTIKYFYLNYYDSETSTAEQDNMTRDIVTGIRGILQCKSLPPAMKKEVVSALSAVDSRGRSVTAVVEEEEEQKDGDQEEDTEAANEVSLALQAAIHKLQNDPVVKTSLDKEFMELVDYILDVENITRKDKTTQTTLTTQHVCTQLVEHVRSQIKNPDPTNQIAMLNLFYRMVLGMDDEDTDDRKDAINAMQSKLTSYGAATLVIDVIAKSDNDEMCYAAIRLGKALLLFGNREVQNVMFTYFSESPDTEFFLKLRNMLRLTADRIRAKRRMAKHRDSFAGVSFDINPETVESDGTLLLRFLQLFAEGHNLELQNYMRVQTYSRNSYDLLLEIVKLLQAVEKKITRENVGMIVQLFETLTEFVQGPCPENQQALAQGQLLAICNRIVPLIFSLNREEEHDLKGNLIKTLLSMLEARRDSVVHDQMKAILQGKVLRNELATVLQRYNELTTERLKSKVSIWQAKDPTQALSEKLMEEGNDLYALLVILGERDPDFKVDQSSVEEVSAFNFFSKTMGKVEVLWEGMLEKVYFPVPPMCSDLSEKMKQDLLLSVNRTSPESKLTDFLDQVAELYQMLAHLAKIKRIPLFRVLWPILPQLKVALFVLACILNIVLLGGLIRPDSENQTDSALGNTDFASGNFPPSPQLNTSTQALVRILNILQIILAAVLALMSASTDGYRRMQTHLRQQARKAQKLREAQMLSQPKSVGGSIAHAAGAVESFAYNSPLAKLSSLYYMFTEPSTFWYSTFFLLAVLGSIWPFMVSFQLLDFVNRSAALGNVVRSVTRPAKEILLTIILIIFIVYMFTTVAFFYFRNLFIGETFGGDDQYNCQTMLRCMGTAIQEGLLNGGGLGDFIHQPSIGDPQWFPVRIFNVVYFFLIVSIALNILFGIIIDTFSALREELNSKIEDMNSVCFICGLERELFDRHGSGWRPHIKDEHNMWQYLFFIIYVQETDPTDRNGVEGAVAAALAEESIAWFPTRKALCLAGKGLVDDEGEPAPVELTADVRAQLAKIDDLQAKLAELTAAVSKLTEKS
eukprot:TRINITY_DN1154_c0_g1_i2.p1 TRINITY_DN1154_c0_g1~~TRINITY_DN1154_c0_g1_i2.p1  ORF type:complete len:2503 (+),score=673.94 TRINITY_DN1154_c0_g1_i2:327-7511(+)